MIVKSGKVVEVVGDVDVLLFDKIGIIIIGNCMVMKFYLLFGVIEVELVKVVLLSSFVDFMFEGKSIVVFVW